MAIVVLNSESMAIRNLRGHRPCPASGSEACRLSRIRLGDQTKIVTASSELARNTLDHGGGERCKLTLSGRHTQRRAARI